MTSGSTTETLQELSVRSRGAILGTLLSRCSGIVRTLIVNATFGANVTLDAFNAAFRFPNSLRDLFADGALSAAFIKVLVDKEHHDLNARQKLISVIMGFFLIITLALAFLGFFFAAPFMKLISTEQFIHSGGFSLTCELFRLLVFYLPLTMLNAIVMGILGVQGLTFRAMNGSIFLSVGMIFGALVLAPLLPMLGSTPVMGLAIGAMLGTSLQLIYQSMPLFALQLLPLPNFNPVTWWNYQPLREVLRLMLPRILGQGALIIALLINTFFAIQIGSGALTYVTTTVLIIQVPIGLFGVATGFAALPILTAAYKEKNAAKFTVLLTESLLTTNWLSLLTMVGLSLFIVPLYVLIFQHGKITYHDTLMNALCICAYGAGIFFAAGGKVLLNGLYAVNATRQIIYNSFAYLIINAGLSAWLAPHLGLIGLGLSFTTATAADFWLNYWVINRHVKRELGIAAYCGKNRFSQKMRFCSLLAYLISVIGIFLIEKLWLKTPCDLGDAIAILVIGGSAFMAAAIYCCYHYGPIPLQDFLGKCLARISR